MNLKLTKKRQIILNTLKSHDGTLSANDIHKLLPEIDIVTIYRNLDLFTKEKIIKQINLGTNEAHYEYQQQPHHHALCSSCEKVIHFTAPDEKIRELLGLKDFQVDEIEVTVKGICSKSH